MSPEYKATAQQEAAAKIADQIENALTAFPDVVGCNVEQFDYGRRIRVDVLLRAVPLPC